MIGTELIVSRLNEPPFEMRLTLAAFDEKSPYELIEVINAVMAHLSVENRVKLRDETPEATLARMAGFLKILNYNGLGNPEAFKAGLLHGDRAVVYPVLGWILEKLPELQKHAHVARFLVNVEVPEHMFADEEVAEVYQRCEELQGEFKEAHRSNERILSQQTSPDGIRKAISQVEGEKNMLEKKVESLRSKLQSMPHFGQMREACIKLRAEQDEQRTLQERFAEQRSLFDQAEGRLVQLTQHLEQQQRAGDNGCGADVSAMKQKLKAETQALGKRVHHELPLEVGHVQVRAEELEKLFAGPLASDAEIREMHGQRQRLGRDVAILFSRTGR